MLCIREKVSLNLGKFMYKQVHLYEGDAAGCAEGGILDKPELIISSWLRMSSLAIRL